MLVRAGRGGYGVFSLDSVKLITSPNVVTNVHKLSKFLLVLIKYLPSRLWERRLGYLGSQSPKAQLRLGLFVCIYTTHFSLTLNTE